MNQKKSLEVQRLSLTVQLASNCLRTTGKSVCIGAAEELANAYQIFLDSHEAEHINGMCALHAHSNDSTALLVDALRDMLSGWKYIRSTHGDLYGVGWDRAQSKAEAALAKAGGQS